MAVSFLNACDIKRAWSPICCWSISPSISALGVSAATLERKRVPARVGAISRDSIVETENGIRFIGTDGIPRLFNGATVEDIDPFISASAVVESTFASDKLRNYMRNKIDGIQRFREDPSLAGAPLSSLNDDGFSFEEIAEFIETNL